MKQTILVFLIALTSAAIQAQDSDCDGMSDADELSLGYDIYDNDSDDNGVSDGAQFAWGGGPDSDFDGLPDYAENPDWGAMTNPLIADTDGDGLCDGYEHTYGKGDPLNPDLDMDGLNDSVEVVHNTFYANPDSDDDGLNDSLEVLVYSSNPLNSNSDEDCLEDSVEVAMALDPTDSTDAVEKFWYADLDEDGFGDSTNFEFACIASVGFIDTKGDCDDMDSTIHPGAEEIASDGIDQDCDGSDLVITELNDVYKEGFRVLPNPSNSGIVKLGGVDEVSIRDVKVFDARGVEINPKSYSLDNVILKLDDLPKGCYFVLVFGAEEVYKIRVYLH